MSQKASYEELEKRIQRLEKSNREQKALIVSLKESEQKFHFLFDNLEETVVIYQMLRNEDGMIIDWILNDCNVMAKKNLGRPFEEAVGKRASELFGKEVMAEYIERSRRVDISRTVESFETYFKINERHYASKVFFITSDLYVNASKDITKRKRVQAEKEKLQIQLNQIQKLESIGRLAGGVAHDFNNMLSVISGYTEMVLEQIKPSEPFHEALMEIQNAARRAAEITRQLLAFARKQAIAPKVLDLNSTIEPMLKMLQRLIGEDVTLTFIPGEPLDHVKIDPSQLDQILANLCVNARDAISGVGRLTIETGMVRFDTAYCATHPGFMPGDFIRLAVSDDGCGMDKEVRKKLFEPFFTTKRINKGTGLGLATVYGIVKQNKGFINVYSEPGQGTTFKIYLPVEAGKLDDSPKTIPGIPHAKGDGTILLVEDDSGILKMAEKMLSELGYRVLASATPEKAIDFAGNHNGKIDLLITDVIMPEMNGRELTEKLLSIQPNLKCLYMSGYTANVIAHHGVLDKGIHFIQKPFSKGALASKVRELMTA